MKKQARLVLVAEDEFLIRLVVAEALTEAGFDVVEAEHADEAIVHLHANPKGIAVLFTDIHMPGSLDGLALAHLARSHFPRIGVLVASGRGRPSLSDLPSGSRFVPKPYDTESVVNHVRELLPAD